MRYRPSHSDSSRRPSLIFSAAGSDDRSGALRSGEPTGTRADCLCSCKSPLAPG